MLLWIKSGRESGCMKRGSDLGSAPGAGHGPEQIPWFSTSDFPISEIAG